MSEAARAEALRALSWLYLDQPLRGSIRCALPILAASPFTLAQLRSLLLDEVHPILHTNLCATAGVWDAFDLDWLTAQIARNLARPRWLRARGRCQRAHAQRLWRLLEPRIVKLRAQAVSNGGNTQALH